MATVSAITDDTTFPRKSKVYKLWSDLGPNDQAGLCQALEENTELSRLLGRALSSNNMGTALLGLQGDTITRFMDLMNSSFEDDATLDRKAYGLLLGLLQACDIIPSSLFISGVKLLEDDTVFYGSFADIFMGFQDGQEVALKRPRRYIGHDDDKVQQALVREALVWRDLNHPNILPFIGMDSRTFPSNPCIVSPWMQNGTILQYIHDSVPSITETNKLLLEVAQGLAFLHRQNIVHGNLNGANILVDQDSHARLSGFSLVGLDDAEYCDSELTAWILKPTCEDGSDTGMENVGVEYVSFRTAADDIYAFGCVCLEIYTVQRVVANNDLDDAEHLQIFHGLSPSSTSGIGMHMSDDLWGLIRSCWGKDPSSRPTMDSVLDQMKRIVFNTL